MPDTSQSFRHELLKLGIISYREQDTVLSIAKKCAITMGLPLGTAIGVASMKAGTVVVPGVGTISAGLAGFLAGLTTGTAMCTAANLSYRNEMRRLLED